MIIAYLYKHIIQRKFHRKTMIQKKCAECDEESGARMQRKSDTAIPEIQADLGQQLTASKSSGKYMQPDTQHFMESRMGKDFSDVKIHTGRNAVEMSKNLAARAFTYGSDIYFNENQYQPHTAAGKKLLAHELTHVIQQSGKDGIQRMESEVTTEDTCAGHENDPDSFSITVTKHYFKTEHGKDVEVSSVRCDPPSKLTICDLSLADGTEVRVIYNRDRNLARVQYRTPDGALHHCRYTYSCGSNGKLNFVKVGCGSSGP